MEMSESSLFCFHLFHITLVVPFAYLLVHLICKNLYLNICKFLFNSHMHNAHGKAHLLIINLLLLYIFCLPSIAFVFFGACAVNFSKVLPREEGSAILLRGRSAKGLSTIGTTGTCAQCTPR